MSDNTGDDRLHEEIMRATAAALGERGFAELTMRAVAARTTASKSTLHYRYDSKEGLITALLEWLGENTARQFEQFADDPPLSRLVGLLDDNLRRIEDPEQAPLHAAYLEINARASRTEAYREALATTDRRYREELATIVEEGIDAGVFRDVDPWTTATLLVAVPDSAGLHAATLGNENAVEDLRSAVNELLLESLLAEDVDVEKGDLL
jgi:AcrR family transcriptional regulator